ncbi:MAG: hypothetical protein AB7V32_05800 [Candidatus Berkiella sp.]
MPLEILLVISLAVNLITLVISFYTLRRYGKISRLSSLIYEQLSCDKLQSSDHEHDFKQNLTKQLAFTELASHEHDEAPIEDSFSQEEAKLQDGTTKIMTKAESHLVKVLQAKYSLDDDKGPQPAGN